MVLVLGGVTWEATGEVATWVVLGLVTWVALHGGGFDNKYILKSQVVPPVCPACPQTTGCPKKKACQPCAPCARCPEPSFDCKKVPNYDAIGSNALPMAYLNSFSAF